MPSLEKDDYPQSQKPQELFNLFKWTKYINEFNTVPYIFEYLDI